MKRFIFHIIVILTLLESHLFAQTDTAFWFAVPFVSPNHPSSGTYYPGGKPVYLVIAALGPTKVRISTPANPLLLDTTITFTAAESRRIDLTPFVKRTLLTNIGNLVKNTIECIPEDSVLNRGLYIRSDRNFITAYYEVDNYYNRDIFALKGTNALGTDFIVPFQRDTWNNADGANGAYNSPNPDGYYSISPYSTIDIVATENNTQVTITPSVNIKNHNAGIPFTITLNRGQTYSIRALNKNTASHMGGTKIVSNKKIAVTIKDDSVIKNSSRDLQGDQNIPKNITGKNYIVMRGRINRSQCTNNPTIIEGTPSGEQVYIYGTAPNTNVTINGTPVGTIGEGNRLNHDIANNATYISADKPVYVYHVTGIGCETGAAVLPTIDGCTGSKLVPIVRSTNEPFYLNIMTTTQGKKYIFLSYTDNANNPQTYAIPENDFEPVGATGWWVLKSDKKDFSFLPVGKIVTVYSTAAGDRFHLGVMNGGGSTGAKYGYFSDYASTRGSASVLTTGSEVYEACYGEPVQIVASGGLSYAWWLSFSTLGDTTINYLSDTTVANPIATPPTGVYIYKVKVTRACYPDTIMQVAVNVLPQVVALFRTDTSQLCSRASGNNKITFYNISPNPDTLEFYWDFNGDNIPELTNIRNTNPITWTFPRNTGTQPVTYKVTLFAFLRNNSSCLSSFSKTITIYPEIDANFTSTATTGCNPLNVTFTNTTVGDTAGISYLWDFGDGNSTAQKSPSHLFQNLIRTTDTTYQVKLIATTRYYCRDTARTTVTVRPFIDASFTVDTTRGCADFTVNITNNSRGAIASYSWNFGDGQTSNTSAPAFQKIYSNNTGSKINRNIRLVVSNAAGCTDTMIRTITVLPKVTASYTASAVDGCNPLTVTFTPGNNNANVTYLWEFGDNNSSSLQSPTHTFENNTNTIKTYTTKLTVTSEDFCVATFTNNITVREKIEANFSIDKVRGCSGFYSNIQNLSFGGNAIVNYTWN
ncbi:MAG: PKD domain-containing protein, partial [Bacteroidales bacterium]